MTATCDGASNRMARGAADRLSLAAAPVFAVMALFTSLPADGPQHMHASPLGGMAVMYLLMAAFHAAPWLNLFSGRRGEAGGR